MITLLLASAAMFAPVEPATPEAVDDKVLARYRTECAGGKSTPECNQLKWRIEYSLYVDLRALWATGEPLDRDVLRLAASAECPQLVSFGLLRLWDLGAPTAEDQALVVRALDNPYPAVHRVALQLAGGLPDPKYQDWATRGGQHGSGGTSVSVEPYLRVEAPPAKDLVELYPGARFRAFASDENRAWFTTTDPPAKVIAALSKAGQRAVLDQAALEARQKSGKKKKEPKTPAEAMALMEQYGGDMMKMAAEMEKQKAGSRIGWADPVEGQPGVVAPRFVVLAESGGTPTAVAIVFRDEILGQTSIVYPLEYLVKQREMEAGMKAMSDPSRFVAPPRTTPRQRRP